MVVALVAVLVVLFAVPVSRPFSNQITATSNARGITSFNPSTGAHVSGSFSVSNGDSIRFEVLDSKSDTVYSGNSSAGTFNFVASRTPYFFEAYTTLSTVMVAVSGQYSAPSFRDPSAPGSGQLITARKDALTTISRSGGLARTRLGTGRCRFRPPP